MKRRLVYLLVFISFLSCSYARELWNGFTTEMNFDQVAVRIRTKYGIMSCIERKDPLGPFLTYPDGYSISGEEIDYKMIRYTFSMDNPAIYEIHTAFLYGKLFAISVYYKADNKIVLDKAEACFGNPNLYLHSKKWFSNEYEIYARCWFRDEKIIILINSECSYTDEARRKQVVELYKEYEEKRRLKALELERKKIDGIVF